MDAVIEVNLDAKCERCGKPGATQSGVCMRCIAKAVKNGEFDHIINKYKPTRKSVDLVDILVTKGL